MDELINQIKESPEVRKEIKDDLLVIFNQNLATKNDALTKAFSQQTVYRKAIELATEVMIEQQDEIEILEGENNEFKKIIGDNKIAKDVVDKIFKKVINKERSEKELKIMERLKKTNDRLNNNSRSIKVVNKK